MIPLRDENPTRITPIVTLGIILVNVAVFFYQWQLGFDITAFRYGVIPAELLHGADTPYSGTRLGLPPGEVVYNYDPSWATVFFSMFLHGGLLHLLSNMWFLWIFGNNVEESMGHGKYLLFYLAAGVAAAAAQILLDPASRIPMIGASGAVAGVLGAYAVIFPGSRVLALVPLGFFLTTMELRAWVVLGFWFVIELLRGITAFGQETVGGVAYAAHVGGFVFGLLLGRILGGYHPRRHDQYHRARSYYDADWR